MGRLLNHAFEPPERNATAVILKRGRRVAPRLLFVAEREISIGEEIQFNYGEGREDAIDDNLWLRPEVHLISVAGEESETENKGIRADAEDILSPPPSTQAGGTSDMAGVIGDVAEDAWSQVFALPDFHRRVAQSEAFLDQSPSVTLPSFLPEEDDEIRLGK